MSVFRDNLVNVFGRDFPGHAIEMPLPRLRFELAVGKGLEQRLETAEIRAKSIFQSVFGNHSAIWLELTFWPTEARISPATQMELLAKEGLAPSSTIAWEREVVLFEDHGEATTVERYWAPVSADSPGLDAVRKAVVWGDHGQWLDLSFGALAIDMTTALGVFPYDDRGLDVFAKRAESLIPIYHQLTDWILEYDRPRIQSELGI